MVVVFSAACACGDDGGGAAGADAAAGQEDAAQEPDAGCQAQPFTADAIAVNRLDAPNKLFLRVSNGDGSFADPVEIHPGVDGDKLGDLILGDFDGDGSIDVLGREGGTYLLRYDSCADTWNESLATAEDSRIMGAGDLDGDSDLDLYGFDLETGEEELVLVNRGDGTFDTRTGTFDLAGIHIGTQIWGSVHTDDLDGDGNADFAVSVHAAAESAGSEIFALHGNGDGTFDDPVSLGTIGAPGNGIDTGDVDGDGDADILAGLDDDGDPGQVYLLRNGGNGTFGAPEEAFDTAPAAEDVANARGFGNLRLYDFDGNGRDDAIVAIRDDIDVQAYETLVYLAGEGGAFVADPVTVQDIAVGGDLRIGVPAR